MLIASTLFILPGKYQFALDCDRIYGNFKVKGWVSCERSHRRAPQVSRVAKPQKFVFLRSLDFKKEVNWLILSDIFTWTYKKNQRHLQDPIPGFPEISQSDHAPPFN